MASSLLFEVGTCKSFQMKFGFYSVVKLTGIEELTEQKQIVAKVMKAKAN